MSRGHRAAKSKRGKYAPNAGAFGSQKGYFEIREERKEREEARRRAIRNAKRRKAYREKKAKEAKNAAAMDNAGDSTGTGK